MSPVRRLSRSSLSLRLLWLTFGVVLLTQALFLLPALTRERRDWLLQRVAQGQLALLSADDPARPDTVAPDGLLGFAGVESVWVTENGRPSRTLGAPPRLAAMDMIDLGSEDLLEGLRATVARLVSGRDDPVCVQGPGPVRPDTVVSVVFRSSALTGHLRRFGQETALLALVLAALTGLLIYLALRVLLVRPMRRLTDSIAAFRADPERTPPLETAGLTPLRGDEVALAGQELADMQRELRAALWRHARLVALGTAVAKVSHDLRGILSPALLSAERLQANPDLAVRRVGDSVVRAVERATDLVRSGLEFAREGPITLNRERYRLRDGVADAVEQCRPSMPAVEIVNEVDEALEVHCDRVQMVRVLSNLIRNAAEAGAGRVVLTANQTATQCEILVSDDGPGLPPQVEAGLFKPFVTGGRRGSTGLGLAIARDLMRAHLGDIVLASTGPKGTVFRLTLPATLVTKPARPLPATSP